MKKSYIIVLVSALVLCASALSLGFILLKGQDEPKSPIEGTWKWVRAPLYWKIDRETITITSNGEVVTIPYYLDETVDSVDCKEANKNEGMSHLPLCAHFSSGGLVLMDVRDDGNTLLAVLVDYPSLMPVSILVMERDE